MRKYATLEEYKAFAEQPPENDSVVEKRLTTASFEVDGLTRLTPYATDAEGKPTDPLIVEAFRDATCAIVQHWEETGDPLGTALTQGAVSIGSVSLGTTSSSKSSLTDAEVREQRIGSLAITILKNAGLIRSAIAHT